MIYYTGDIHGQHFEIVRFCKKFNLTREDTVVILGDVAANYYGNGRDNDLKDAFKRLKPTIFCVHGNHEMRPWNIPTYKTKNGTVAWFGMRMHTQTFSLPKTARFSRWKVSGTLLLAEHTAWTSSTD